MTRAIFVILFLISFPGLSQPSLPDYLLKHSKSLNLKNEIDFSSTISDLDKYLLFAQGEVHGIPSNQKIKLALFKYLYRQGGVRNIIVELGNADAFLLNQFLLTGNKDLVPDFFQKTEMEFWWGLKKFNDDNARDIKIVGIDFERNSSVKKTWDLIFATSTKPHQLIEENIRELKREFESSPDSIKRDKLFKRTKDLIIQYRNHYQDYLKDHFQVFLSIINNPVPVTTRTRRDKFMVQNLKNLYYQNKEIKYFGQFGISHANRNFGNLIGILNSQKDSPFQDRVMVILPQYFDCEAVYGDKKEVINDYGLLTQENIKNRNEIRDIFKDDITLVELINLIGKYENLKNAADYMVIVKNQKIEK